MNNKILRTVFFIILSLSFLSFSLPVAANPTYGANAGRKLGSGIINITTGWLEIPKSIVSTSHNDNIIVGVIWGFIKGIGNAIGRTLVGVGELTTFFIPTPDFIHPRYVFQNLDQDTSYGLRP
ncbi:exosortase system-associated protein, TIGR04073 family [Candidatus Nitrosacidococcus sp. I8]|uniref:exosortase system-associated protein, TIGR04073 family n=1 Tax=Candidatus Nitrosacidococcus sp. I8 TaxID=2942908 RepID=UPI0022264392|nr:exosortase system-associated protein, TIGR04073 family [Candidatus Nitrosacidococcus sp. I8]CAH9019120.1 hypothetical protein NURINAE_01342 [Candidatus Nitrosacidococcus sp. I8]